MVGGWDAAENDKEKSQKMLAEVNAHMARRRKYQYREGL